VDPWTPITVTQPDGQWPGWLLAWRRTSNGWVAFVRYRRGPGMNHLQWVGADEVRPSTANTTSRYPDNELERRNPATTTAWFRADREHGAS
jgi:hypothetical protein